MDIALPLTSAENSGDRVELALRQLRSRLSARGGVERLELEFIEDDLREGQRALRNVEDYFDEVLRLLTRPDARAADYVDLADDSALLTHLDALAAAAASLRRRLMRVAARSAN